MAILKIYSIAVMCVVILASLLSIVIENSEKDRAGSLLALSVQIPILIYLLNT